MICPDLKVGLIFEAKNKGIVHTGAEIIAFDEQSVTVKILFCDGFLSSYLDADKIYKAELVFDYPDMKTWDIISKMKRSTSQVLLEWQKNSGNFNWDLDS